MLILRSIFHLEYAISDKKQDSTFVCDGIVSWSGVFDSIYCCSIPNAQES